MSKFIKLPDKLKSWKINAAIKESDNGGIYKVSKRDYDGSTVKAILRNVSLSGENYNTDNIDFLESEASFLQMILHCGNNMNYIDVFAVNKPSKERIDLYILTEDVPSLSKVLKAKTFTEDEIVEFGIQISSVLEILESKNIFHGNLTPDNIYVTNDGTYKIGGFSDTESEINDLSFVAPEIHKKENADFTTDIYSLGLIMYYMSNGNKLPFENDETDRNSATQKRMTGAEVSSPQYGSDKLKSVIMIACKADNKYRWKNAGNIKSALLSMRSDTVTVRPVSPIPASTEFDGNVFEEFEYDEVQEPVQEEISAEETAAAAPVENEEADIDIDESIEETSNITEEKAVQQSSEFEVIEADTAKEIPEIKEDEPIAPQEIKNEPAVIQAEETIDDEEIFDSVEIKEKNNLSSSFESKDYGSFFDDDEITPPVKKVEKPVDNFDIEDESGKKAFDDDYDTFDSDDNEISKRKKSKAPIIIVAVIAVVVILGVVGFMAISGINGGNNNNTEPSTQASTNANETTAPSTEQPTTEALTTAPDKEIIPVVGYGYSYAKKLLEADGFKVEIGEYHYSEYYPEGYVIAQSPEASQTAKQGTVITLDISSGLIEPETEPPTEAPTEPQTEKPQQSSTEKTNNSYIFPNSSTSYLSKSDVEKLSADELTIAINEIYARNGRKFTNESLANYFNSQSWYKPLYSTEEFDRNVKFNEYEQANLQLMISYR